MEAAASAKAKPGRQPPPIPPNYVSLRQLQELRRKEKEEQERRRREEEEAAAAAKREVEMAAKAAAIKREAALKEAAERRRKEEAAAAAAAARREAEKVATATAIKREPMGRAASWEASGGAKERHRGGPGNQWVAVAHPAPVTTLRRRGHGAAGKREAAIGGGRCEKGPDDVPANAPHGGGKPQVKGKEKVAEVVPNPPSSHGGKPENRSKSKANGKTPADQAAESSSSGGPAEAAILSSRDRFRRGRPTGAGGRSADTCTGIAPVKTAGPSPPPGVKSDGSGSGKKKSPAPRRADAVAGIDSPGGMKASPAQAPSTSAADGSSTPTSGGELRKNIETKPGDLVEGQRRRQVVEVHAVAEVNPQRVARCSAPPWRARANDAAEQHGRVWVPKAAAAAGSSTGAGL